MKIQGEIKGVHLQKNGLKIDFYVDAENEKDVTKLIFEYAKRPITIEILIDEAKVIEDFGTISDQQRKKIYALIKDFAREYGESDTELMKAELKGWFCEATSHPEFSLSNVSTEVAGEFIEFIIQFARETGYEFAFKEDIKDNEFIKLDIENQICSGCGEDGKLRSNKKGDKICLCNSCMKEFQTEGVDFLDKHHIKLVKF